MTDLKIIIKGIDNASGAFKSAGRSLDDLEGKAGKAQKALGPLNTLLGTGLKVAAGAATLALGALGAGLASSVLDAADMQQGVADIGAAMGTSATETEKLKKLIFDLGFDPTLVVSATDAADAIMALGTAGVPLEDILGGAAKSTILLANATGADFGDAADIATSAMSVFGVEAGNMQAAIDSITGVTLESKFKIDDYALALGTGAKGAAAAGLSLDQFNQMLTAVAPNFTSGMTAGSGMTAMILGLVPSTDKARSMMQELGMITADGANRFFDINGEMKSNEEISRILRETMGGLTTEQRLAYTETLFGRDAMGAVNGMIKTTDESWRGYAKALDETDAQEQARKRMDTFKGSLSILGDTFDSVKLGIGDKFLPVLTDLVDKLAAFLKAQAPQIVTWAGDMATKLGALIETHLPAIIDKVGKFFDAIGRLITVVSQGELSDLFLTFEDGSHYLDRLFRAFGLSQDAAMEAAGEFIATALTIRDMIGAVTNVVRWIGDFILGITDLKGVMIAVAAVMALNALVSIVSFVAGVYSAVTAVGAFLVALSPVVLIVGGIALAIYGLYTAWQNNFLGIRDITQNVLNTLRGWFSDFPGTLQSWGQALGEKARWAMEQMRLGLDNARSAVRGAFDSVVDFLQAGRDQKLGPFAQSLYDAGNRAVTRLGEGFRSVQGAVSDQLQMVLNDAKERGYSYAAGAFAGRMYDGARASMLRFVAGISESNLAGDLQRALERVGPAFDGWVNGFRNHVYGPARDIANRIMDGINDIDLAGKFGDKLYQIATAFNDFTSGFWNHVYGPMKDIGGRIVDGIADGLRDAWGRLQDALSWIASVAPQWIKDALGISSPSKVFADIGKWIPPGIAEGIMQTSDAPLTALTDMFGQMTALPATGGGGGGMGDISTVNNTTTNFNVSMPGGNRGGSTSQQTKGLVDQLVAIYA